MGEIMIAMASLIMMVRCLFLGLVPFLNVRAFPFVLEVGWNASFLMMFRKQVRFFATDGIMIAMDVLMVGIMRNLSVFRLKINLLILFLL